MDAEEVLKLFDSCWFNLEIFKEQPSSSSSKSNTDQQIQEEPSKPVLSRSQTRHIRSITSPKRATLARGRRRKKGMSKSLSDLEFDELKGFIDLGFVFSEGAKDSSLVSIIPGLHRLGKKDGEEEKTVDESAVPRPYLSEAWEVLDRRKKENPLMNWRVPALSIRIMLRCLLLVTAWP
ncbi:unnamed protein product, partial [Vitis vinifera]